MSTVGSFDYIVVGAGSAGCTVAARLAERGADVLLVEAGPERLPENVATPALWYTLLGSEIDYGYQTIPQPALGDRRTVEPRGKGPGGSSNLYLMMHIRGHRLDYDAWAYDGCPGWAYDDCVPYFERLERVLGMENAAEHGPNPTSEAFIRACAELGFPSTDDFNGPEMLGAGWHHLNIRDGRRWSGKAAYLDAAAGKLNLGIVYDAIASRLLFERGRCSGVEWIRDGAVESARAAAEVVLCAGALESPKLLLLSGIGPHDEVRAHGIPLRLDLPGVGKNFHNHVLTGVIRECVQPVPPGKQNLSEAALFCTSAPGWPAPDLQLAFVHVPFDIVVGQGHPNSVSILPGVVRPLSRGWIRLASANPLDPPVVNPNYLAVRSDLERLAQAVELARDLFATAAFAAWVGPELMPGPDVRTHDEVVAFCRRSAASYHHQAGSCKMGLDDLAVVDPELRVVGVDGLRVADASIMPAVPSGNCNAGIVMVAERCADLLAGSRAEGDHARRSRAELLAT